MRKVSDNPERILNGGICATCRTASTCMYLRGSSKPILRCEEFEEFSYKPKNNPVKKIVSQLKDSSADNPVNKPKYSGLCANCNNRDTCNFIKPQGGVWHCEEYE